MNYILKRIFISLLLSSCLIAKFAFAAQILGYVEKVVVDPGSFVIKAKLDTGAVSASLDARHIQEFIRKGQKWVRFEIPSDTGNVQLERRLVRYVRIKSRHGELKTGFKRRSIRRPVVHMRVTIGNQTKTIEVNLTNRNDFNYPFLLGRKPLILFGIAVNPALTFVSTLKAS
jgi:hypothetical protein